MCPSCFRPIYWSFRTRTTLLATCLTLAMLVTAARVDGAVVVSCGFELAGDTWTCNGVRNVDTGAGDHPSGQRILNGSGSWLVTGNTTSTLIFSEVLLYGWTDVSVTYRVSSTASTTNDGHGSSDWVEARVADKLTGLAGSTAAVQLKGNTNAVWGYNSGASQQVTTAGSETLQRKPGGGGLRTSDGFSDFRIIISNGQPTVALQLSAKNSSAQTYWNLDDVVLDGTPTNSHNCLWTGGSNTWDNSTRWTDQTNGNAPSVWNSANGDNACFSQAGNAITIADETTVAARSLTFNADGCTVLAGDSVSKLALTAGGSGGAGGNTIEVTNLHHTATINAPIISNPGVGITKTGAGTLVLGGINTYTGPTIISNGTLALGAHSSILGTLIDVQSGATLDLSAFGPYTFTSGTTLRGSGTIVGNLVIAGSHDVGNSPGVQCVEGNYAMNGTLLVEVNGDRPGNSITGYDQLLVSNDELHNAAYKVSLSGALSLAWGKTSLPLTDDKLWIIRNNTAGTLAGSFNNYTNGSHVGDYNGRSWSIYYGADADTGHLTGGNDVLLAANSVPEPGSLLLVISGVIVLWLAWCGRLFLTRR